MSRHVLMPHAKNRVRWERPGTDLNLVTATRFRRFACSTRWLIGLICIWVRALTVPMHLGLNWRALCAPYQLTGPLCPISIQGSPVTLLKFQIAPRFILSKKDSRYACLSEAKASQSQCGPRFHPLLHTSYTMDCLTSPLSDGIMSNKKTSNDPGLCPITGRKPVPLHERKSLSVRSFLFS